MTDLTGQTCKEKMSDHTGFRFHNCGRKAVAWGEDSMARCSIHSPATKAKRRAESNMRYIQDCAERSYDHYGRQFFDVLHEIAKGHNDPRRLARKAISEITGDKVDD